VLLNQIIPSFDKRGREAKLSKANEEDKGPVHDGYWAYSARMANYICQCKLTRAATEQPRCFASSMESKGFHGNSSMHLITKSFDPHPQGVYVLYCHDLIFTFEVMVYIQLQTSCSHPQSDLVMTVYINALISTTRGLRILVTALHTQRKISKGTLAIPEHNLLTPCGGKYKED
jgi:hypothetical protein